MSFRTLLSGLLLASAVVFTSFSGSVRAEDRVAGYKYVTEKPEPGEKSRVTSYDQNGVKVGVKVVYTYGITRNESYRPTGTLNSVHETNFKGFSHDTEYASNGTTITSETWFKNNEKESVYEYNADGSFRVTWYGFANGNKMEVDEISKAGDVVRTHYTFDGKPSGHVSKGKRVLQPDFVVRTTWFNNKTGVAEKIEYVYGDQTMKTAYLESDGVTVKQTSTIDSLKHSSRTQYLASEYFSKGKLTSNRTTRLDKGLDLCVFYADGKTMKYKQVWRFETGKGTKGRVTNWLLSTIQEFDVNGRIERELTFDTDGKNVTTVKNYANGVLVRTRTLRNDATDRVNGTVEKDETFQNGVVVTTVLHPATAGVRENIAKALLLDPVFKEDEPGKIRIIR